MHEPDFWTHNADALEMSIEGNRLIVREIADAVRDLTRRLEKAIKGRLPRRTQPE